MTGAEGSLYTSHVTSRHSWGGDRDKYIERRGGREGKREINEKETKERGGNKRDRERERRRKGVRGNGREGERERGAKREGLRG